MKLSSHIVKKIVSSRGVFVTGTDTDIGKTFISTALLDFFKQLHLSTIGIKPIASGCHSLNNQLVSDDALKLMQASTVKLDYSAINPIAIEKPIAPHFEQSIFAKDLQQRIMPALAKADVCVVEGVGGWLVPLNHEETIADFAALLNLPIILVVGIRLGCLNHALLTAAHMQSSAAPVIGWIANKMDPNMHAVNDNIDTLKCRLPFPLLDVIEYRHNMSEAIDEDTHDCLQKT